MRKLTCALLCLLMILSTTFCLTGCKSRTDEMGEQSVYTEKQMNKIKNKIVDKIKNCLAGQFFVTSYKDSSLNDHQ